MTRVPSRTRTKPNEAGRQRRPPQALARLARRVSFDAFKASLLGGTLDVEGLTIGGGDAGGAVALPPLVHVRRTLAHVSLGRALMREVAVKSLTLERPVVRVVWTAGGETNLPRPARRTAEDDAAEEGDDGEGSGRWAFDCEKVLLVDGEIHVDLQGRVPYRLSVVGLVGELRRTAEGDYDVTLIADAVRATQEETPLGEFKAHGKIAGAADLSRLRAGVGESQLESWGPCCAGGLRFHPWDPVI